MPALSDVEGIVVSAGRERRVEPLRDSRHELRLLLPLSIETYTYGSESTTGFESIPPSMRTR